MSSKPRVSNINLKGVLVFLIIKRFAIIGLDRVYRQRSVTITYKMPGKTYVISAVYLTVVDMILAEECKQHADG